jgi:hypothetical protein
MWKYQVVTMNPLPPFLMQQQGEYPTLRAALSSARRFLYFTKYIQISSHGVEVMVYRNGAWSFMTATREEQREANEVLQSPIISVGTLTGTFAYHPPALQRNPLHPTPTSDSDDPYIRDGRAC